MDNNVALARLVKNLAQNMETQRRESEELSRRVRNMFRPATIDKVHASEYRVEVSAADLKSAKVPWTEVAGANKTWFPPSAGQKGYLISPSGEPGVGFFLPVAYTEEGVKPPSKNGDEYLIERGNTQIHVTDDAITLKVGSSTIVIKGDSIKATSATVETDGKTVLDGGTKAVHRVDDKDSDLNTAVEGAPRVFA